MKTIRYTNRQELAKSVASEIVLELLKAENPYLVLPGGSSPIPLFEELARQSIDWGGTIVSTTDERCVPPHDAQNNASQILSYIPDMGRIYRLWEEGKIVSLPPLLPTVTVLGMGEDGHFASIFPGMDWDLSIKQAYEVFAPKPPFRRVTQPLHIFIQTKTLVLLVCGSAKEGLIEAVKAGEHADLPVARLMSLRPDMVLHACQ